MYVTPPSVTIDMNSAKMGSQISTSSKATAPSTLWWHKMSGSGGRHFSTLEGSMGSFDSARKHKKLVRTQNFFGKGKAPPTLIEDRELGLFFYGGATTVRSTGQGWLRRVSIAGYSDSAKANSDLFCPLYSVEIDALADGALFGQL